MTDAEIERRIMALLSSMPMSWREIVDHYFRAEEPYKVDAAMYRLERCGAIRLNRRTGKYERYD